jgi:hypothetical protein
MRGLDLKKEKKHCQILTDKLNLSLVLKDFNAHSFKLLKSNLTHHGQSNTHFPLFKLKEQLEVELNNLISVKKCEETKVELPPQKLPPPPPFCIIEESKTNSFEWNLNSIVEECIISSNSSFIPHVKFTSNKPRNKKLNTLSPSREPFIECLPETMDENSWSSSSTFQGVRWRMWR